MGLYKDGSKVAGAYFFQSDGTPLGGEGKKIAGAYLNGKKVFENFKKEVFTAQVAYVPSGGVAAITSISPKNYRGYEILGGTNLIATGGQVSFFRLFFVNDVPAGRFIEKIAIQKAGGVQTFVLDENLRRRTA
jgi:Na+-transporting NADH:ubiquinone oxidoreductase subunit NqrC